MSKRSDSPKDSVDLNIAPEPEDDDDQGSSKDEPAMKNYGSSAMVKKAAGKMYTTIVEAFEEEKREQIEQIEKNWDIYNCELTDEQVYSGDSQIFVPIVRDAVDARVKRFAGMLFPNVGNLISVISETGVTPQATMSLLQRHVRFAELRTLIPGLLLNGDIEGQWSILMDWKKTEREVTRKKSTPGTLPDDDPIVDVSRETIIDEGPSVEVISAQDLAVIPATISDIQDAEIVAIARRLSEDQLDDYVEEGWFLQDAVDKLLKDPGKKWAAKDRSAEAGIKLKTGQKFAMIYMVYAKMKVPRSKKKVPCLLFLGGPDLVLGCVRNPFWSQKIPVISESIERVPGSFWGRSKVEPVAALQYQLNDVTNMGMDSAEYCLLPIVMTDPLKNPRVGGMLYGKAAIWETSPNDTKISSFPPLYKDALMIKNDIKQQIMESMDVNETMLGKAPQGRKNAQAIAAQSSEAMATIGDFAKRFEVAVMDKQLEWMYELDAQFRDDDMLVMLEGQHGMQAVVETLKPSMMNETYWFKWNGTDAALGAQRIQQMMGMLNVFRGIPPDQLNGRRLDVGPILDFVAEATFGPTMTQNILIDERHKVSIKPELENEFLFNGGDVIPSPMDDDAHHLEVHHQGALMTSDQNGSFRRHMQLHMTAMQKKQAAQQPQGSPGMPGAPQGQPGAAGTPRPGAMPGQQRPAQQPPGAIHQDQMQDPQAQPRG
jgi:hypothetical protein